MPDQGVTKFISKLWFFLNIKTKESDVNFFVSGYLILFGFIGWYLIWHNVQTQPDENLFLKQEFRTLSPPKSLNFYIKNLPLA